MKRISMILLLIICIVPYKVNAKEYCKVISGNGKDIGSEIACGNENFYRMTIYRKKKWYYWIYKWI